MWCWDSSLLSMEIRSPWISHLWTSTLVKCWNSLTVSILSIRELYRNRFRLSKILVNLRKLDCSRVMWRYKATHAPSSSNTVEWSWCTRLEITRLLADSQTLNCITWVCIFHFIIKFLIFKIKENFYGPSQDESFRCIIKNYGRKIDDTAFWSILLICTRFIHFWRNIFCECYRNSKKDCFDKIMGDIGSDNFFWVHL